jgi:hypothetical protein
VVIRGTDRVADVLAQDESLVDVFVAAAPAFARLRNPGMRRVMARLVTVEQAARVAGVDLPVLLRSLNDAAGSAVTGAAESADAVARAVAAAAPAPAGPGSAPGSAGNPAGGADSARAGDPSAGQPPAGVPPAGLAGVSPDRIIELDVRDDLRNGQEPFSRIMAARRDLAPDGALCLRAIFEPVPLYAVFAKQGLAHWTDRLADDDWIVWFYSAELDTATDAAAASAAPGGPRVRRRQEPLRSRQRQPSPSSWTCADWSRRSRCSVRSKRWPSCRRAARSSSSTCAYRRCCCLSSTPAVTATQSTRRRLIASAW